MKEDYYFSFCTKFEDEKKKDYKTKIKKIFYNLYNIWYIIKIFCQTYYTPFYCDIYYLFYRITHSIKSFILSLIINLYL